MKFYFHPTGMDNNGNTRVKTTDPNWIKVETDGDKYDDALDVLPLEARDHIIGAKIRCEASWNTEYDDVRDFIASTAGWGIGFSLLNELDWEGRVEGE